MTLTAEQERAEDLKQGFNFPKSTYSHPDYTLRLAHLNQRLIFAPTMAQKMNGRDFLPTDIFYPTENRRFYVDGVPTPKILPAFIGANGREMLCNFQAELWPFKYDVERKISFARNAAYTVAATTLGYESYSKFPHEKGASASSPMDIAIPMTLSIAFAAAAVYATKRLFNAKSKDAELDATYAIRLACDRLLQRQMLEMNK